MMDEGRGGRQHLTSFLLSRKRQYRHLLCLVKGNCFCLIKAQLFFLLIIILNIGDAQVKIEGDINQGVAYYKKALFYNWHYADAMYNLGVAYGEMLNFEMVSYMKIP